jgi:hypothetical protein
MMNKNIKLYVVGSLILISLISLAVLVHSDILTANDFTGSNVTSYSNISGTISNLSIRFTATNDPGANHLTNLSFMWILFSNGSVMGNTTLRNGTSCGNNGGAVDCADLRWWNTSFDTTTLPDGLYNLSVLAYNHSHGNGSGTSAGASVGIFNGTIAVNITVDNTAPNVSSSVTSSFGTSVSTTQTLTWTTHEYSNYTLQYGTTQALGTSVTNTSFSPNGTHRLTSLSPSTTYYFNITFSDRLGNTVRNGTYTFSTSQTEFSGGGGGSKGKVTNAIFSSKTVLDLTVGKSTKQNFQREGAKLQLKNIPVSSGATQTHSVTYKKADLTKNEVTVEIASTPQTLTIKEGDTGKADVDGDGMYDVSVTVNAINSVTDVDMTVEILDGTGVVPATETSSDGTTDDTSTTEESSGTEDTTTDTDSPVQEDTVTEDAEETLGVEETVPISDSSVWIVVVVLLLLAGAGVWYFYFRE